MQRWQRRQQLPEEAPFGGRCLSPGGKRRCRCGLSRRRPTPSEVGGWGSLGSAGVVPARDPGRAGAQAAHPRRRPVLTASGGRRCASPRGPARGCSSPGRPLCPRQEPGDHGSSRRPQLQPVFVASSRSTARPWLAAPRFARGWGGGSPPPRLQAPAAARLLAGHAPAPAGCKERRRECTGPSSSCSEPRVWGEGKPESSGSRVGGSGRWRLGCSPGGLGAEK